MKISLEIVTKRSQYSLLVLIPLEQTQDFYPGKL